MGKQVVQKPTITEEQIKRLNKWEKREVKRLVDIYWQDGITPEQIANACNVGDAQHAAFVTRLTPYVNAVIDDRTLYHLVDAWL